MITDQENWQENADENQNANSENENAKESRYAHVGSFDGNASDEQRPHRPTFTRAAGATPRGDRPQRPRFSRPASTNSERVTFNNRDERPSYGNNREYGQDRRNSYGSSYGSYNREDSGERRPYRPSYNREDNGDSYNSYGNNGYNNNRGGGYNRNQGGGYGNNRGGGYNNRGGYNQNRGYNNGGYNQNRGYNGGGNYEGNAGNTDYNNADTDYNNSAAATGNTAAANGNTGNSYAGGNTGNSYGNGGNNYGNAGNNYGNGGNNYGGGYGNNYGGGYGNRGGYNQGGGYGNRGGYGNGGGQQRPRFNNQGGGYNQGGGQRPRFNNQGGGYNQGGNRRPQQQQQGGGFRPRKGAQGAYNPNAKYSKKKQIEYKEEFVDPNEPIRLNKYLANAGVCSRREADEFITAGAVTVNGEVVSELGTKVKRGDQVTCNGQPVTIERKIYILLNKPKDCVTTSDDPQERKTVMDYVKGACTERIYPVGRLDRNTTGVLLLTNDGDLASKLTHPKFLKKKIYHVRLDKNLTKADMDQIAAGITLDDGEIHADAISYVTEDKSDIGIEIHSGKNRIVRRIFESLGYRVVKLDRVFFAGLTKKALRRGQWRFLTEKEVNMLRMGAFE